MESTLLQLKKLVEELEQSTGNKWELTLQEFGKQKIKINSFGERNSYTVYDMKGFNDNISIITELKKLEGTYSSIKEIQDKVKELQYADIELKYQDSDMVYDRVFWKCPKCQTFGDIDPTNMKNRTCNQLCQNRKCHYHHNSIWFSINIDIDFGNIYITEGGTLQLCTSVGKVRID